MPHLLLSVSKPVQCFMTVQKQGCVFYGLIGQNFVFGVPIGHHLLTDVPAHTFLSVSGVIFLDIW